MKVCYMTAQVPYGNSEQFINTEVKGLIRQGVEVVIVPLRPSRNLGIGKENQELAVYTKRIPFLSVGTVLCSLATLVRHPIRVIKSTCNLLSRSGNIKKMLKNTSIIPKALATSFELRNENIDFIHAHWASTPSSMAYIVATVLDKPWGFTAHRWDITENNACRLKVEKTSFCRLISKAGRDEMLGLVGDDLADKLHVVYMGVDVPDCCVAPAVWKESDVIVAMPANFLEVKGHKYLVRAMKLLKDKGDSRIKVKLFGDGPLFDDIKEMVASEGLDDRIFLMGRVGHEELIKMYRKGLVNIVILPSVETEEGQKEGIPVALMEAMAHGIPTVGTNIGAVPELLDNNSGIITQEKSPESIANALWKLAYDKNHFEEVSSNGYAKVRELFNNENISKTLISLFDEKK